MAKPPKRPRLDTTDDNGGYDDDASDHGDGNTDEEEEEEEEEEEQESMFKIETISHVVTRRFGTEETVFRAAFNSSARLQNVRLLDLINELRAMFEAMLERASQNFTDDDLARITISHDGLNQDIVVHLRSKNRVTPDTILDR